MIVKIFASVALWVWGEDELCYPAGYTRVRVCGSELESLSVCVSPLSLAEIYCC